MRAYLGSAYYHRSCCHDGSASPISQWSSKVEPMPMSAPSWLTQAWMVALWPPMVTFAADVSDCSVLNVVCSTGTVLHVCAVADVYPHYVAAHNSVGWEPYRHSSPISTSPYDGSILAKIKILAPLGLSPFLLLSSAIFFFYRIIWAAEGTNKYAIIRKFRCFFACSSNKKTVNNLDKKVTPLVFSASLQSRRAKTSTFFPRKTGIGLP